MFNIEEREEWMRKTEGEEGGEEGHSRNASDGER
jgi:hypothetical protein